MLGGRFEGIDNADARARLERGDEIVEQGVCPTLSCRLSGASKNSWFNAN